MMNIASAPMVKKIMFLNRRAPHGTIYALEGLEVVLAASAFDQNVSLVFMEDGVYQLVKGQDTKGVGLKNFANTYRALADFDVRHLYVEMESLQERSLSANDLIVPVEIVETKRLGELMEQQDVILSF
jgi:tRNA 2-thiouridine synthesizing protein C